MSTAHHFPVTVYYEDTDMAGIVYYANYLRYIERARSQIVRELGFDQNAMRKADLVFAVRRIEADYLGSARLGDELTVRTTHDQPTPVRWRFEQEIFQQDNRLFKATVTAICMTTAGRLTRFTKAMAVSNVGLGK
ncbi:MAG: YbgC/FadM family acyl-CoA thioesterase [Aestuariivita sp.]|nr:YbgC/FadM family acyl-CoA thioesterase [Aestuariivita sp.]MCY4203503.1 YbgC/FadM family acyl-CoA thioesterase [Aestuariivita sp.]MCY4288086.1 YbgC/FadM family acyl-CoA thioesterase [Aestuariivita sp.]MCY4346346.1 YbgC/FadM family acyl-CoA thioesterase [Aestuariivita sp.]